MQQSCISVSLADSVTLWDGSLQLPPALWAWQPFEKQPSECWLELSCLDPPENLAGMIVSIKDSTSRDSQGKVSTGQAAWMVYGLTAWCYSNSGAFAPS
jgi:hypothetical protein